MDGATRGMEASRSTGPETRMVHLRHEEAHTVARPVAVDLAANHPPGTRRRGHDECDAIAATDRHHFAPSMSHPLRAGDEEGRG